MSKLLHELSTSGKFTEACKPLFEFVQKYGTPHSTVIVTQSHAEFLNGEMMVSSVHSPIYTLSMSINSEGCSTKPYAIRIEGRELTVLKDRVDELILTLAKKYELNGQLEGVMVIEKDGEYYDSDEQCFFVPITRDKVIYGSN